VGAANFVVLLEINQLNTEAKLARDVCGPNLGVASRPNLGARLDAPADTKLSSSSLAQRLHRASIAALTSEETAHAVPPGRISGISDRPRRMSSHVKEEVRRKSRGVLRSPNLLSDGGHPGIA
jgi:hypothetical protein